MKKTIYFIRHGETEFNKRHIVQGKGVNSDLNETGKNQGFAFYDAYKHINFEVVFTSSLKRTHQTVQSFIDDGITWEQYPEIDEISWGVHEGAKGTPEMKQNYIDLIGQWVLGNYDARIEGGESAQELGKRVEKFMEMLKRRKEQQILVCTHGRTMTCISCFLEERPLKDMVLFKHHNTGLTKAVWESNKFSIEMKDDLCHLQP